MVALIYWLIRLIVVIAVVGLLVWAIERYWPFEGYLPLKRGVQLIVILAGVVAFLQYVGMP